MQAPKIRRFVVLAAVAAVAVAPNARAVEFEPKMKIEFEIGVWFNFMDCYSYVIDGMAWNDRVFNDGMKDCLKQFKESMKDAQDVAKEYDEHGPEAAFAIETYYGALNGIETTYHACIQNGLRGNLPKEAKAIREKLDDGRKKAGKYVKEAIEGKVDLGLLDVSQLPGISECRPTG